MKWLGIDIGGANLKISDGDRFARSEAFTLWREPEKLPARLAELIASAPASDAIAATMTGELADCFCTKAEGVRAIVDALVQVAGVRRLRIYLTNGEFVPPGEAVSRANTAAASNWHALARFAARHTDGGAALLIDIGSTTTDVIPLSGSHVVAQGSDDTSRLIYGELVYTGVERTPLAAVVDVLPYRCQRVPVASELFATTRDAYLLLKEMLESLDILDTADGRPATRGAARDRLARMICADRDVFDENDAVAAAEYVRQCQTATIGIAVRRVLAELNQPPTTIVISGSGEFLARRVAERLGLAVRIVSLGETLGPSISTCAAAHAVAVLAREGEYT